VRDYLRSTAVESAAITFEDDRGLRAHIRTVSMSSGGSAAFTRFSSSDSAIVDMGVTVNEPVPGLDLVCILSNATGAVLLEEHMSDGPSQTISAPGRYTVRCTIPPVLPPGDYIVGILLGTHYELIDARENVVTFSVDGDDLGRPRRMFKLGLQWRAERTDDSLDPP
ncbi:MAG TPA: Wzt carbohydrate-binding domain-containing protein, partial [Ilumatobacteraceae bacterium]|nr:Wzt carbohydrate-binding domain-containing protein [Ilumatobacteraceae bacterium]